MNIQTDSSTPTISSWFVRNTRPDDTSFITLAFGAPDWLADAVHSAHDGELPNDWRYQTAAHIVEGLADDIDGDGLADSLVDIYTADLINWLAGNLSRTAYCDEAISDGIWDRDHAARHADTLDLIRAGQYVAISAMVDILATAIEENQDAA